MKPCPHCKEMMIEIRTPKGKTILVDPDLTEIITAVGIAYRGYIPHYKTCPADNEFSKKKPTGGISMLQWQCPGCGDYLLQAHDCQKCGTKYEKGAEEKCLPKSSKSLSNQGTARVAKPKFGSMAKK